MNPKRLSTKAERMDAYARKVAKRPKPALPKSQRPKEKRLRLSPLPLSVLREANYLPDDGAK